MDEITINEEQLLQESRKRIAADLAAAVKQSAKTGAWELEDVACEVSPDNILRKTMDSMRAETPRCGSWKRCRQPTTS